MLATATSIVHTILTICTKGSLLVTAGVALTPTLVNPYITVSTTIVCVALMAVWCYLHGSFRHHAFALLGVCIMS